MSDIRSISRLVASEAVFTYALNKKWASSRHVLLAELFPEQSVARGIIGGLETSLGTTLWEKLAKSLAVRAGYKVLNEKEILMIPKSLSKEAIEIANRATEKRNEMGRQAKTAQVHSFIEDRVRLLHSMPNGQLQAPTKGRGVDLALEINSHTYLFDLKTVQVNAGDGVKLANHLMTWLTHWAINNQSLSDTSAHIAFPYNPFTDGDWWNHQESRVAPLDRDDIFLEGEFWDLVSGQANSYHEILGGFRDLATTEFIDLYWQAMVNPSIETKVALVCAQRNMKVVTPKRDWTSSKIMTWNCNQCGAVKEMRIKAASDYTCGHSA